MNTGTIVILLGHQVGNLCKGNSWGTGSAADSIRSLSINNSYEDKLPSS